MVCLGKPLCGLLFLLFVLDASRPGQAHPSAIPSPGDDARILMRFKRQEAEEASGLGDEGSGAGQIAEESGSAPLEDFGSGEQELLDEVASGELEELEDASEDEGSAVIEETSGQDYEEASGVIISEEASAEITEASGDAVEEEDGSAVISSGDEEILDEEELTTSGEEEDAAEEEVSGDEEGSADNAEITEAQVEEAEAPVLEEVEEPLVVAEEFPELGAVESEAGVEDSEEVPLAPEELPACANSTFQCCSDYPTMPAHGLNGEGCCLQSLYGCCPDNISPAEDKNGAGCECAASAHGCCPDEATPARGPGNEGCACQFTTHGCCPDQYTPASGPDSEGCSCSTYAHGCCPDGETIAGGPNMEGCPDCSSSEFGCCPDGFTPAEGPYDLGCGCAGSKFGCCPDGVSEASDPAQLAAEMGDDNVTLSDQDESLFPGCGEVPGEACHFEKDAGTCKENFTVRWFFDRQYGGCSRFWWSGCGGNNNRFINSKECEKQCVHPEGSGKCYLPKVTGPCRGSYNKWYFDRQWGQCMQFKYGGCLGNDNRFESKAQCQESCLRSEVTEELDVCSQPLEPGPCRGLYSRFYYDQVDGECKAFNYTGCKGNRNRFMDLESCQNTCRHKAHLARAKRICTMPKMEGLASCRDNLPSWHFDDEQKRCRPFFYSGCGGNENRFASLKECEMTCPNAVPPEIKIKNQLLVVEEKQSASFKIKVEANPPAKISWKFGEDTLLFDPESGLATDERFSQSEEDGSLQLVDARLSDAGIYTVMADNGLGHIARNQFTLKVQPEKMDIEVAIDRSVLTFKHGTSIVLPCAVKGYPIPIIRWYKNNTPLPRSERINIKEDNTLEVKKVTIIDGGTFMCRATNKHESVSDSVEVLVEQGEVPKQCIDKPEFANCELIVRGKFCNHEYYSDFCCESCVAAGQLGPGGSLIVEEPEIQEFPEEPLDEELEYSQVEDIPEDVEEIIEEVFSSGQESGISGEEASGEEASEEASGEEASGETSEQDEGEVQVQAPEYEMSDAEESAGPEYEVDDDIPEEASGETETEPAEASGELSEEASVEEEAAQEEASGEIVEKSSGDVMEEASGEGLEAVSGEEESSEASGEAMEEA